MKTLSKTDQGYTLGWAKKIRAIQLKGGKCLKCDTDDIFVLEFHHFSIAKEDTINQLRNRRWSAVEKELEKCELLCANCHRDGHCVSTSRNYLEAQRKLLSLGVRDIRCEECDYLGNNWASLSFHHNKGNKAFTLNDALYRKISVSLDDIAKEISKCEILCCNCHRVKHIDVKKFNLLKP